MTSWNGWLSGQGGAAVGGECGKLVRIGWVCVVDVVEEYVLGLGRARGFEEVKGGHQGR